MSIIQSRSHLLDAHGNPMSGDAATIELYDRAIDRFVRFHPEVITLATELAMQEAPAPMSHALIAYLHLTSTDRADVATAQDALGALAVASVNEREEHHARAIGAWVAGDWGGAARHLDELLERWPTDLLAVMMGHQLAFFVGDAADLRDRPVRSLRAFDADDPHRAFVQAMVAFGLEESGHYGQALEAGLAALEVNPDDVWAVHAVVHVHEMQGQIAEGIRFMEATKAGWAEDNLFTVHNWWHLALYLLEAGRPDRSLAIYDERVHHAESPGAPLEMVDASAMLWRLRLDDLDTGGRFDALADAWGAKSELEPWYAFNDLHAVMAFAGAGRLDEARDRIRTLDRWLESGLGSNVRMTAEIGLPASRAVLAFVEDRHEDVIAELAPIRRVLQHFGGSHAQRDALQRTLLESALRAGRFELARSLTAERLGVRDTSPYSWAQRARAMAGVGDADGATAAEQAAATFSARLAAAV
jgi:tetratricopeptide (TPR) repeat protein